MHRSHLPSYFHLRPRRRGTITLEWVVIVTVIIVGTVGAVAAVRNALLEEYVEILDTICQTSIGP